MEISAIIFFTLIASAFFSGLEIAFLTSNKLRIELENKQGGVLAQIISYFNNHQSKFLGAMLLGNTIAVVAFGIVMEQELHPVIQKLALLLPASLEKYVKSHIGTLLLQTFISTMFILVTAEFLPKNLFRINPNRILNFFAIPLFIVYWILYPVVFITIGVSEFILSKIFGVRSETEEMAFSRIDLDHYLQEGSRSDKKQEVENEVKIFQNALDFSSVKARECMVPRTEIIAIDADESIEKIKEKFIQTRLSKILIYEKNIDRIIGYIHSHELFKNSETIRSILLPVNIVPESMPVSEVLTLFIQQRKSIAIVVDEFGGTSGMLTMEDVMEEIFGEIEDEHDKEEMIEKKISEIEFLFSGRLEIDYLNEKYKFNLPSFENFETLAGLFIHLNESIPQMNEEIRVDNYSLKVMLMNNNRVEQVKVMLLEKS